MMSKEEIKKSIYECNDDIDIEKFVSLRLNELEEKSEIITVGQNYTDTFNEYISSKVSYKPAEKFSEGECPSLVYDDIDPYISLIKEIKLNSGYNETTLFTSIWRVMHEYLPNEKDDFGRFSTYKSHVEDGMISIKEIKDNDIAFCSEKAGLSHNMFRLLGIESSLICGTRNNEEHAYNIVYPNGYENDPAIIFDSTDHINFKNEDGNMYSFGYHKTLTDDEEIKLINGEIVELDMSTTEEEIRKLYGAHLVEYEMEEMETKYGIGIEHSSRSV